MKIGSHSELHEVVTRAVPTSFLGETHGCVIRSIGEAFGMFNGLALSPTSGISPFAFATIEEMIPNLIRGRLQTHLTSLAERYESAGISWSVEELGKSKHKFIVIKVRDEFNIILTKYNNGTKIISSNRKRNNIAQVNGSESLFEEIRKAAEERENVPTLFLVYGYKSALLADIDFDETKIDYVHLVLAAKDAVSNEIKHYRVDLSEFADDAPTVIPMVPHTDGGSPVMPAVLPREEAIRRAKRTNDSDETT